MISFKSYLAEARMAPLYHGTLLSNITGILDNGIKPDTNQQPGKLLQSKGNFSLTIPASTPWGGEGKIEYVKGVSTTRSLDFAKRWANKNNDSSYIILQLDQSQLNHKYKILPFNYWNTQTRRGGDHRWNEFEEFVITTSPINKKYITAIHYFTRDAKELDKIKDLSASNSNIKFIPIKGSI